jgi:hypothetical protein
MDEWNFTANDFFNGSSRQKFSRVVGEDFSSKFSFPGAP